MTKEEKIQETYGKYWSIVVSYLDENGWCRNRKWIEFEKLKKDIEIEFLGGGDYYFRPKSLQGIENNNGWVKIKNRDCSLNNCFVYTDKNNIYTYSEYISFMNIYELEQITHFKLIIKPQSPIY